jgi:hypothetical protein
MRIQKLVAGGVGEGAAKHFKHRIGDLKEKDETQWDGDIG